MITADQLLCHAIGDYVLQSHWMATEKTKRSIAALFHVATYSLPFLFLRPSLAAYAVIISTHFVIDRWRLARYVVWLKNFIGPLDRLIVVPIDDVSESVEYDDMSNQPLRRYERVKGNQYKIVRNNPSWAECKATGFSPDTPTWLAVWLLIIADNIMHVTINGLALKYL